MEKICLSMRNLFNSTKNHKLRITDVAFLRIILCTSVHDPGSISTSNYHNSFAISFSKEPNAGKETVNY